VYYLHTPTRVRDDASKKILRAPDRDDDGTRNVLCVRTRAAQRDASRIERFERKSFIIRPTAGPCVRARVYEN